jgi:hypothetical protein
VQKKCPIYFSAIDQVKVTSISCAKNIGASFSAVAKNVPDFFYLCKKSSRIIYQFLKCCAAVPVCFYLPA